MSTKTKYWEDATEPIWEKIEKKSTKTVSHCANKYWENASEAIWEKKVQSMRKFSTTFPPPQVAHNIEGEVKN